MARSACYFDVSRWRRFGTDTPTTSFLDFSHLEHAQAPHEHRTANDSSSSTQYDVRGAFALWSQVCRVPPHTALAIYSHDQYTWLHLVDRPWAVVLLSPGPRVASKKFCRNRLSSCCQASSCDGYSMEEQLTNARLCHYIFNPLIKPWEWQILSLESGADGGFCDRGGLEI